MSLLYLVSVPIIALNFGFKSPQIDLNHNIREIYKTKQENGTDKDNIFNRKKRILRRRLYERYSDQRSVAQFYVHSWFIASFNLDLDDNTLLRIKDVYAKAISSVGNATKGNNRRGREWRKTLEKLRKINSTFNNELKGTLNAEQYKKLIEMTGKTNRKKERNKKDQGET